MAYKASGSLAFPYVRRLLNCSNMLVTDRYRCSTAVFHTPCRTSGSGESFGVHPLPPPFSFFRSAAVTCRFPVTESREPLEEVQVLQDEGLPLPHPGSVSYKLQRPHELMVTSVRNGRKSPDISTVVANNGVWPKGRKKRAVFTL